MRSYFQLIISRTLFATGIISLTLNYGVSQAQSIPSDGVRNTSPNVDRISPDRFNNIRPVQQQYFYPDSGGSQQFFRQDSDHIYFLPEENSDSILQIDEDVEIKENSREQPSNK